LLAAASPDSHAAEVEAALRRLLLVSADQPLRLTALEGGVSSAIYRADLPCGVVCVKRALARLRVAADWQAPVERSRYEADWLRVARGIVPANVPALLGEDPGSGTLVLEWLDPARYMNWKT